MSFQFCSVVFDEFISCTISVMTLVRVLAVILVYNLNIIYSIPTDRANTRIIGGSVTNIENVPYLMQLRKHGQFMCGGTLVALQYVVSAAHCVKGLTPSSLTVIGGASTLSEIGERRSVTSVFIPKDYNTNNLHMDVAVLKLKDPMIGTNIKPIRLCGPNSKWSVGEKIQVSGWGITNEHSTVVSQRVRTANIPLIAKSKCKEMYKNHGTLTSTMFCASVPGISDACAGDSGGPAIYNEELCGIVSWGVGCARNKFPGVYTSIRSVKSFIERAMLK